MTFLLFPPFNNSNTNRTTSLRSIQTCKSSPFLALLPHFLFCFCLTVCLFVCSASSPSFLAPLAKTKRLLCIQHHRKVLYDFMHRLKLENNLVQHNNSTTKVLLSSFHLSGHTLGLYNIINTISGKNVSVVFI